MVGLPGQRLRWGSYRHLRDLAGNPSKAKADFHRTCRPGRRVSFFFSRRSQPRLCQVREPQSLSPLFAASTPAMEAAGQPRQITFGDLLSASPVWTRRKADHLCLGAKASPRPPAARLASSEKSKPLPLSSLAGTSKLVQPALSRDGRRLAFAQRHSDHNIWRIALSSSGQQAGPPIQLIASTFLEFAPQYSQDGQKVAFSPTAPERLRSGSATALDRTLFN